MHSHRLQPRSKGESKFSPSETKELGLSSADPFFTHALHRGRESKIEHEKSNERCELAMAIAKIERLSPIPGEVTADVRQEKANGRGCAEIGIATTNLALLAQ